MIKSMFLMNLSAVVLSTSSVLAASGETQDKAPPSFTNVSVNTFTETVNIANDFNTGDCFGSSGPSVFAAFDKTPPSSTNISVNTFTETVNITGDFNCGVFFSASVNQRAFELDHSNISYNNSRMHVGTAKLSNLTSINGEIQYVAVEKGELLYKGKTYGPGKYRGNSSGALEQCE